MLTNEQQKQTQLVQMYFRICDNFWSHIMNLSLCIEWWKEKSITKVLEDTNGLLVRPQIFRTMHY